MLVDANLLLFAVDESGPFHRPAKDWLTAQLNGDRLVGLPWESIAAFLRISTHPRASEHPLSPSDAWAHVTNWLDADVSWVPQAGPRYTEILGDLIIRYHVSGNLVPDARLAALAAEHGLTVYSADADFARFRDVRWANPLEAVG